MRIQLVRDDRLATSLHGEAHSIAKPANDLLGFRDDDRYLGWLKDQWGKLAPSRREVESLAEFAGVLGDIAIEASRRGGTIDYARLAPLLSQVRRFGPREIEVRSLAELATWAFSREFERGIDQLVVCRSCGKPYFARPPFKEPYYCQRPAPNLTMTCAQLYAHERFTKERAEWSKEYRKIMARKLRGKVSELDFRLWKDSNRAGVRGKDWIPFDEWAEQHEAMKREVGADPGDVAASIAKIEKEENE
jgi:hypothetical protein